MIKFTMQFIEGHRKELKNKYKKFESFDEKFVVDDDMLAILKEIGEKEGVKFNEEQYQKTSSSEVVEVHILVAALSEEASVAVASEVEAQVVAGRIINN